MGSFGTPPAARAGMGLALWRVRSLAGRHMCPAELSGANPTVVSQHLAKLRLAGLVKGRREGTFVYYRAADVHVRRLLSEALFHADHADNETTDDEPHQHPQLAELAPDSVVLGRLPG
jgi:hypothetical protein